MDKWMTNPCTKKKRARRLLEEEALEIAHDKRLQAKNDPCLANLLFLCSRSDDLQYHINLHRYVREKMLRAARNPDAYFLNLPPRGRLPKPGPGRAVVAYLPNGEVVTLPLGKTGTSRNVIFCGSIGIGKSNRLMLLVISFAGECICIVLSPKGDMARLAEYNLPGGVVSLNAYGDVRISLAEGLNILPREPHLAQIVGLICSHQNIHAASRLLTNLMDDILEKNGNTSLSFSLILERLRGIDAARTSKLGGYRDSLDFALSDIIKQSGPTLDYAQSNFIERLLSKPGTYVINTGGLPIKHSSLLASLIYRYVYEKRRVTGQIAPPVLICIDDSLPFVSGSHAQESEGHTAPVAQWSTLGRGLGIGLILCAQNFSLLSPTLRNNTDTIVTGASYGDDVSALARHMSLTPEQASVLPLLRPGEVVAIARSQWPLAVRGWLPEVR